ncbi:spry domain containing socs box protein [Anaeramoeba flamelloides]|uniref:Spry domain containing socs box protein n=1 Tax=Anaeramoeba flamelloides TaxID=1746091 RepID=A0AAV7Y4D5_9EUKA|nr:spry domain containing socs box protein [Anaeramoeba flamelloides]|eukprot:Anaeramoba_flamelloidesa814494_64.p1 GENE.a814494_64~~a814494_64.p1  ORF type:complete len:382 (-),score=104.06 a814494_64:42-1187(-)
MSVLMPTQKMSTQVLSDNFLTFENKSYYLKITQQFNYHALFELTCCETMDQFHGTVPFQLEESLILPLYQQPSENFTHYKDGKKEYFTFKIGQRSFSLQKIFQDNNSKTKLELEILEKENKKIEQEIQELSQPKETTRQSQTKNNNYNNNKNKSFIISEILNEHSELKEKILGLKIKNKELNSQINLLFKEMMVLQPKKQLDKKIGIRTQIPVEMENNVQEILFSDTFNPTRLSPVLNITDGGSTVARKWGKGFGTCWGKSEISGKYIFHIMIKLNFRNNKSSSNVGIMPFHSVQNTYKEGWVIDSNGATCAKDGEWPNNNYSPKFQTNDVYGITLDLVNGKIGFCHNEQFLGWRFHDIDTNAKYKIGVDLWTQNESATIL